LSGFAGGGDILVKMSESDLELLARYTRQQAEDAFAEIVRRHLDLVFSAALRQVRSPQLAEEVAQSAFTDLARQAHRLAPDTVLTAWLYQVTRRTAIDVVRREARRQLREQVACELNAMNTAAADWTHIEPLLDDAMQTLEDTDRTAVLLRYFENKSLREVGQTLGTNEDAARKRVSRAVERLREFFAKRGVTISASGLVVAVSANAVQAAPAGLAVTICTAAALAGKTIAATATATATITKAIAMTTLQKSLVTVVIIAAVTTPLVLKHREVARLRKEVVALRWERASLSARQQGESAATAQVTANLAAPKVEVAAPAYSLPAEVVAKIAALLSERKPMDKARMEAWAKLMAQISPDQMDQALQAALQLPDHEVRTAVAQTLFRNWVETNPRAALAFATVNFQGKEKSDAIRDALQRWAAQDPDGAFATWRDQAADLTKRLGWGGDQQEIVKALFEGMAQQDFQKAVEGLKGLDWDLFGSALKGMGVTAAKTEQGRKFFLEQLKRVSDLPVSYEAMSDFIFNWSQYDLPSAMNWVENQPAGKQRDYAVRQVGLTYVRRDPKTGADWWLAQATPAERSQALFGIAQTWAITDIKAAGEWLNQQGNSAELDSGRSAFADVAVEHDPVTALKWAESITQPTFRNQVLVQTWQKWHRSDSAAAEQFLAQCGWPADLVARARGNSANR
jgi:RNA polymerase sigma factor (sigma-70 family)